MNLSRKTFVVAFTSFCFSFLLTLLYLIFIFNSIINAKEETKIINIVLMSYSFIASTVFLILSLTIKNYKLVVSNRNYTLEFFCMTFPVGMSLIAWNILSALFVFFPIVSFLIFIFSLFIILIVGLIIHIILSRKKEVFFIFNNGKIKIIQYEKGNKTVLLEKDIAKEDIVFDDNSLTIHIKNTEHLIKINDEKYYLKKKASVINKLESSYE